MAAAVNGRRDQTTRKEVVEGWLLARLLKNSVALLVGGSRISRGVEASDYRVGVVEPVVGTLRRRTRQWQVKVKAKVIDCECENVFTIVPCAWRAPLKRTECGEENHHVIASSFKAQLTRAM
jgi:hypothetical protein